jgi:hypothetical protein
MTAVNVNLLSSGRYVNSRIFGVGMTDQRQRCPRGQSFAKLSAGTRNFGRNPFTPFT